MMFLSKESRLEPLDPRKGDRFPRNLMTSPVVGVSMGPSTEGVFESWDGEVAADGSETEEGEARVAIKRPICKHRRILITGAVRSLYARNLSESRRIIWCTLFCKTFISCKSAPSSLLKYLVSVPSRFDSVTTFNKFLNSP